MPNYFDAVGAAAGSYVVVSMQQLAGTPCCVLRTEYYVRSTDTCSWWAPIVVILRTVTNTKRKPAPTKCDFCLTDSQ